jgi:L-rhamnose isomerase / sugar isomerase
MPKNAGRLSSKEQEQVISRLLGFTVEVPSWGFADTGTRFGKFLQDAAAVDLEDKLQDAGTVHKYTGITPTVAVHVLWDFPNGFDSGVLKLARKNGVSIGAVNPNVFQDQQYKFGSVTNQDPAIRKQATEHILDSIRIAESAGSGYLSLWFADGSNFPGQADIRRRKFWATDALKKAHKAMPKDMTMLVEYKPFEPACYYTDFFDWGSSYVFCKAAGPRARVLVDLGHHLQGTNIEQIVAWLMDEKMLGGFHFNDHKYADDDLTTGSIDPYQTFRIFSEIAGYEADTGKDVDIAWMIDQSHNIKPKVEAMIQTTVNVQELFAKACLVDRPALRAAQDRDDVVAAEETLRKAFFADITPLLAAIRKRLGVPADPLAAYRASGYEQKAATERTAKRKALGLDEGGGSLA